MPELRRKAWVLTIAMFLQKNLNQTLDTRLETGKIVSIGSEKSHRVIRNGHS